MARRIVSFALASGLLIGGLSVLATVIAGDRILGGMILAPASAASLAGYRLWEELLSPKSRTGGES